MTNRSKKPVYYKAPLKSKKQIIGFLTDHRDYYRSRAICSPLAWNVKSSVDFTPEHLIEVYRQSGEYDQTNDRWLDYPEWQEPAFQKYKKIEDILWESAVEDATRSVQDDDAYKSLWDGTELKVEYEFEGRSGGWLIMTEFNGANLTKMSKIEFEEYLEELPYQDLRNLYQLVVQNDHDFRTEAVNEALEFHAAFCWIEDYCSDIPRPNKTQATLAFA